MVRSRRLSLSLAAVLALWVLLVARVLVRPPGNAISWDTFGYHLYLPATFIHHDPGIGDETWVRAANDTYKSTGTLYQISELPNGRWVNKYPMGLALLWSPFFAAGHFIAGVIGAPQDGFSKPYQWALIAASLVYLLIGLLVLRKVLRSFFSEAITATVLALIVLGTNYLSQSVHGTGMPHTFLFALGAGVIWHSLQWHRHGRRRDAVITGALLGLLVISRPSEIVWVLVPLLVGLSDLSDWRQHTHTLWSRRRHLLLMAMAAALVCLPQLLYWKGMTGRWLYMSYNNPGEGFEFLHPYTHEFLFSFRKGWYVYTPLMLVATLGCFTLRKSMPVLRVALIAFFVLNLYIVSSWSCWWYADSFGQRAMVQSYALMALPLGAAVQWIWQERFAMRLAGEIAILGLMGLNLFQHLQFEKGLIHSSRMTWPAYKAVFGALQIPQGLNKLWSVERSYSGERGTPELADYRERRVARLSFDPQSEGNEAPRSTGTGSFLLSRDRQFSPAWECEWRHLTGTDHVWIKAACSVQRPADSSVPAVSLVASFEHDGLSYAYQAQDIDLAGIQPGEWLDTSMWYLSPEVRRPTDKVKVYCWLRDTLPVQVDELGITVLEPLTNR